MGGTWAHSSFAPFSLVPRTLAWVVVSQQTWWIYQMFDFQLEVPRRGTYTPGNPRTLDLGKQPTIKGPFGPLV